MLAACPLFGIVCARLCVCAGVRAHTIRSQREDKAKEAKRLPILVWGPCAVLSGRGGAEKREEEKEKGSEGARWTHFWLSSSSVWTEHGWQRASDGTRFEHSTVAPHGVDRSGSIWGWILRGLSTHDPLSIIKVWLRSIWLGRG